MGEVCIAEAAAHLSGTAPIFNLSLHGWVTALDHTGDNGMALAGALQIRDHLTDRTAGIQRAQPSGDVRVGVVRGFFFCTLTSTTGTLRSRTAGSILYEVAYVSSCK